MQQSEERPLNIYLLVGVVRTAIYHQERQDSLIGLLDTHFSLVSCLDEDRWRHGFDIQFGVVPCPRLQGNLICLGVKGKVCDVNAENKQTSVFFLFMKPPFLHLKTVICNTKLKSKDVNVVCFQK